MREINQKVVVNFLDKNKNKIGQYNSICFADWKDTLPEGTEFLHYKPYKFNVDETLGGQYVDFLKKLWHFRRTLWGVRYPKLKDDGVLFNARRFDAFEFYTTVVALRYVHELPDCLRDWQYYCKFYETKLEAYMAAHAVPIHYTWNYGHSLFPKTECGLIEGATPEEFEKNFPHYKVKMNKWANIYFTDAESKAENWSKDIKLHRIFCRPKPLIMGYDQILQSIDMKLFIKISPVKAKEILDDAKTNPFVADRPLPVF